MLRKHTFFIVFVTVILFSTNIVAQTRRLVKQGNEAYRKGDYVAATDFYTKALGKDSSIFTAQFNKGNSLYQQKNFEESERYFKKTAELQQGNTQKSKALYNTGNALLEQKKWDEAIEFYKKALLQNPIDEDARYNLTYAKKMKQNQKNEQPKDDQKQDQKKQDENKQNEEQQKPNDEQQKQNQEQQKRNPSKISKEQADQLLNALKEQEKKVQDKMMKGQPSRSNTNGKDW